MTLRYFWRQNHFMERWGHSCDNIHRPAISFQIYTPRFLRVDGRIMPSENESEVPTITSLDDFRTRIDRFIT